MFYYTEEEKANSLNDYFTSVSSVDASSVLLPQFIQRSNIKISEINITISDVDSIISMLSVNKAVGPD